VPEVVKRFYAGLLRVEVALAATFLVLMVLLIFGGGVARMLRHPLNWTIDFATCFFAWGAFLAADVAWRRGTLMNVELVVEALTPRVRLWIGYANHLIIAAFLVYIIGAGVWLAIISGARSFQGIPWLSYSWVTMSLPAGAALLLVTTLIKMAALRRQDSFRPATDDPQ
jgi:TRAP-type C4-dicarboxylate transport system permease small subunit